MGFEFGWGLLIVATLMAGLTWVHCMGVVELSSQGTPTSTRQWVDETGGSLG